MERDSLQNQIESIEKDRKELAKKVIEDINTFKQSIGELLSDNSLELLMRQILEYVNQEKDEQKREMEEIKTKFEDVEKKIEEAAEAAKENGNIGSRMEEKLDFILQKLSDVEAEYKKALADQKSEYEKKLTTQKEKYETELKNQKKDYETELENQKRDYETKLTKQNEDFTLKLENQEQEVKSQQEKKQKVIDEVGEDFRAYEAYKNWEGNGKKWLDMIRDTEFTSFLISCMDMDNICGFYKEAITIIQGGIEQDALDVINAVIDSGIRICNRIDKDSFSRQTIREGECYDRKFHTKTEGGSYSGTVKKVYFQGIQKNGEVWKECKGYVEVANSN